MRIKLPFKLGQIWVILEPGQALRLGSPMMTRLIVRKIVNGKVVSQEDLGSGLVTNAGVNLLAADWTNATATLKKMNYHDTGTGTLTPAVGDTVLQIPTGAARGVGSQTNIANVYQTTGQVTFGGPFLVTEWGLFSAAASGTMWDHRTWAGTNVNTGEVLEFVYQLSIFSGG